MDQQLEISQCISLACLWEVTAGKPGNVHRAADFEGLHFADLLTSGALLGAAICPSDPPQTLGETILKGVQVTRAHVTTNTNLGIILLLAPLAQIPRPTELNLGIRQQLDSLTPTDSKQVYEAIRLANPGGMGNKSKHDLKDEAPESLLEAMHVAKDHDLIAAQYVNGFQNVCDELAPRLAELVKAGTPILDAIVRLHVECLAVHPDSLIRRKRGAQEANQASAIAANAIKLGQTSEPQYQSAISDLDFWLRSAPGRNPGTTADLITAAIFCCLRDNQISFPISRWTGVS